MTIRQVALASNLGLDFNVMPKWGLNGTYTEVFMDKPVALEFADHVTSLGGKVETARLGGKFYVCWTGKYVDTQAWRKARLQKQGTPK